MTFSFSDVEFWQLLLLAAGDNDIPPLATLPSRRDLDYQSDQVLKGRIWPLRTYDRNPPLGSDPKFSLSALAIMHSLTDRAVNASRRQLKPLLTVTLLPDEGRSMSFSVVLFHEHAAQDIEIEPANVPDPAAAR